MFTKFGITKGRAIAQIGCVWLVTSEARLSPERLHTIFVVDKMTLDQAFLQISSVFAF
jgi:hypothetical protein